jgi:DNA-binding SARP family transcriptional activator
VVTRRIDAERLVDSAWHDLGRALATQGAPIEVRVGASVRVLDFGPAELVVDDEPVHVGLSKSFELLAYLCVHRGRQPTREALLDALFDGRHDKSGRAYLRKVIQRLRSVLPDDAGLIVRPSVVMLDRDARVRSESEVFETGLGEAARLQGAERLSVTVALLASYDCGPYLIDSDSSWVQERRRMLDDIAMGARLEAAHLAFDLDNYDQARALIAQILRTDPYREVGWRLAMRLAGSLGDDSAVMTAYRSCERALAEIGTRPSAGTRDLLTRLRR